jgi:hypothetical protein
VRKKTVGKYFIGIILGFLIGFMLLHPVSMVFAKIIHPADNVNFDEALNAFDSHHMPMAIYFGLMGLFMGLLNVYYMRVISKKKKRVALLEGLLPICAYCKDIRDDAGKQRGTGDWHTVEDYLAKKTSTDFTHGICPDCFKKVIEEDEV